MSNAQILGIVMAGRTVKYLVMGWVTANAPGALVYFGVKGVTKDALLTIPPLVPRGRCAQSTSKWVACKWPSRSTSTLASLRRCCL